jgi:quercetin dioxygenase-like cupin family protein
MNYDKTLAGTFEADPQIVHHFSDGLYAKQMVIPAGMMAGTHQHNYSHLSVLASGRVLVTDDKGSKEYSAPACIEIKSHVNHTIYALSDAVWFCIHATEETDADKVDQVLICEKD